MSEDQQQQLVDNIAGGLSQCSIQVQDRMTPHFDQVDPKYGTMVRESIATITGIRKAS
jgi:catalase